MTRSKVTTERGTFELSTRVHVHVGEHQVTGRVVEISNDGLDIYVEILTENPALPGWRIGRVVQCFDEILTIVGSELGEPHAEGVDQEHL